MQRPTQIRLVLALQMAAVMVSAAVVLAGLGLPLAARRALTPGHYLVLLTVAGGASFLVGVVLLVRAVARPVERLFAAAEQLESSAAGELPILGAGGDNGRGLSRAAVAFERLARALAADRGELAAKVAELTAANRELAEARESLIRTEKLATVGRLAAGVAHEVGNPLGAISGYADLARSKLAAGQPIDDYLVRIGNEAQRIDRIVRGLLDFARPSKVVLAPIELAPVVEAALRLAQVQARFKAVEVERTLPPDLPRVIAEEHALAQVLLNVLLNAGDAMKGAGKVRIAAVREGDWLRLTIADTGPGIPAEHLPHVFDPFFTTKDPGQGTGLGLAICYRIMESFGGEITAGNGEGGGAKLALRLGVS
jgi:C4-dicarboxylate-specific signal transduction histidine kinase